MIDMSLVKMAISPLRSLLRRHAARIVRWYCTYRHRPRAALSATRARGSPASLSDQVLVRHTMALRASTGSPRRSESHMSKVCVICGKKPSFGNNRSHSMRATPRRWDPNVQKVAHPARRQAHPGLRLRQVPQGPQGAEGRLSPSARRCPALRRRAADAPRSAPLCRRRLSPLRRPAPAPAAGWPSPAPTTAASQPLLPAFVPARSTACSMVSVVSTPKITGTPGVQAAPWPRPWPPRPPRSRSAASSRG